jgi:hypothetical protein
MTHSEATIDSFIDAQHGLSIAATTINRRLATLRTFFECLATAGWILICNPEGGHGRIASKTLNMTQRYARMYDATVKRQCESAAEAVEGIYVND